MAKLASGQPSLGARVRSATQTAEISALFKYEDFLAKQLPVGWMPNATY